MDRSPICATVIEAGKQLGLEYREDVNDLPPGAGDSIGWCQQTRGGRRRASAARTYLHPALKRPNLQLVTNALVHRVLFDGTQGGKRATGVEFSRGGAVEKAEAVREVILSAGAVGSPHILQLSGVGDAEHLAKIGVPVVHELRGVGRNMQDHYTARVSYPVVGMATANEKSYGLPLAMEVMRWVFTGKGMLSYSPSLVAASVKVLETSATPDMQVTFAPGSFKGGQIGELERTPGLSAGAWQMRPLSRGYVEAKSNRPGDMPAINPRYLSDETDRRAIIGGLRFARRLFDAPPLKQFVREESLPGTRCPDGRRVAGLRAAQRQHVLSCQLHLHDGFAPDERRRQRVACARYRWAAGHRRLGDAGRHLDQHERTDDHDRRKGCGDDQGRGAAKTGGVASFAADRIAHTPLPPVHRHGRACPGHPDFRWGTRDGRDPARP